MINKVILKEILKTKRENKIKYLSFHPVFKVNEDDFINLLQNHAASKSCVVLRTTEIEAFNELNQMLDRINKISPSNEWIRIVVWFMQQRYVKHL